MMHDDPLERRHAPPLEVQVAVIAQKVDVALVTLDKVDQKVDTLDAKMQRVEGVVGVVRFLGIGGVLIALAALLKAFGIEIGGQP